MQSNYLKAYIYLNINNLHFDSLAFAEDWSTPAASNEIGMQYDAYHFD